MSRHGTELLVAGTVTPHASIGPNDGRRGHLEGPRSDQVLVVDNVSADGTDEEIAAHPLRPWLLRMTRNVSYAGALAAC